MPQKIEADDIFQILFLGGFLLHVIQLLEDDSFLASSSFCLLITFSKQFASKQFYTLVVFLEEFKFLKKLILKKSQQKTNYPAFKDLTLYLIETPFNAFAIWLSLQPV